MEQMKTKRRKRDTLVPYDFNAFLASCPCIFFSFSHIKSLTIQLHFSYATVFALTEITKPKKKKITNAQNHKILHGVAMGQTLF